MWRLHEAAVTAAVLLSEGSWLFLLLSLLGAMTGGGPPLFSWPGVLLLMGIAVVALRWLSSRSFEGAWFRVVGAALGVACIYGTMAFHYGGVLWPLRYGQHGVGPVFMTRMSLAVAAGLALWWRGTRLSSADDLEGTLRDWFPLGLGILVFMAILEPMVGRDFGVRLVLFPFFGASLGGIALAGLEASGQPLPGRWVRVVTWALALVLVGGFLAGLLTTGPLSGAAAEGLQLLGLVLEWGLVAVLFVVLFLVRFLVYAFAWLLNRFTRGEPWQLPDISAPDFRTLQQAPQQQGGILALAVVTLKWFVVALLVVGVLLFLAFVLRARRRRAAARDTAVRESIREEAGSEDLGDLLSGLLPRFSAAAGPQLAPLPTGGDPTAAVMRAYLRLLNAAASGGWPRSSWETPLEFAPRLAQHFPEGLARRATEAFLRVRYGGLPAGPEEAATLEEEVSRAIAEVPWR